METQSSGSVTRWLDGLQAGEDAAAQAIWDRYFADLVAVAQARLKNLSQEADGEDVALSALKSVMLGIQDNRFEALTDRTSLWPLLVTITARKSTDQIRRQLAGKRSASAIEQIEDLRAIVGREPDPEFAVAVGEELERLVNRLGDTTLRTITQRKLEGCTNREIASELSISVRSVIRKLHRIRQEWEEED